jgi:DNA gyrase subunit A
MRLKNNDLIVGMDMIYQKNKTSDDKLLIITENGFGKMSLLKSYRLQRRGGSGIKTAKVNAKTGKIIGAWFFNGKNISSLFTGDLLLISKHGQVIRLPMKSVPTAGRATQGVRLMRFKIQDDQVGSFTLI